MRRRKEIKKEWADYRAALICQVVANCHRNPKVTPRPWKASDFMPAKKKKKQTPEDMYEVLKEITLMHGGEVRE